jgi:hypothetical protein
MSFRNRTNANLPSELAVDTSFPLIAGHERLSGPPLYLAGKDMGLEKMPDWSQSSSRNEPRVGFRSLCSQASALTVFYTRMTLLSYL